MTNVYLIRDEVTPYGIRSVCYAGNKEFHFIERPWINNQQNISCVPSGVYQGVYLRKSASGKYRSVYHIQGVKDRSGILIHNGNLVAHSKGCLIIGKRRGILGGKLAVLNSRTALREFVNELDREPFNLHIIGSQNVKRAA